jgi:hypothetical protein
MNRPEREPPTAAHMLAKVRADIFPPPRYALQAEVRIEVGTDVPELRTADAVVVDTSAGERWRFIAIETKRSRADLAHELRHPEKAAPHDRVCGERYFVLPAPAGDYLMRGQELPVGVGLIEVGSGACPLIEAVPHRVDPPSPDFLKAIFRVGAVIAERLERDDVAMVGAPLVPIVAHLDRTHAALACGHRAPLPLVKKASRTPRALPCFSCLYGLPTDRTVVLAALACAAPEEVAAYLTAIDTRAALLAAPVEEDDRRDTEPPALAAGGGR